MKLELSDRAKSDLLEIRSYTIENFGVRQAALYRGQLEQGFATLRRFPAIGLVDRRLPPGHQAFRVAQHWICYEAMRDIVLVKAVIKRLDDYSA